MVTNIEVTRKGPAQASDKFSRFLSNNEKNLSLAEHCMSP